MKAVIAGTGLIGASIGLGLRQAGWHVSGWDPISRHLDDAMAKAALDEALPTLDPLPECDILIVAAPPRATLDLLASLRTESLVIDVAGIKEPVLAAAGHLVRFVGTHPMAGREVKGAGAASAALFRGAAWVVVADDVAPADLDLVTGIVDSLGAEPVFMSASAHDRAVAAISHLPQILASALIGQATTDGAMALAAGSFRDLTRVAASDSEPWVELLDVNRTQVAEVLGAFVARLDSWRTALTEGDLESLAGDLAQGQARRRALAPPVIGVRVALADEPGELARVGHALESTGVDVRDLQLRHAPHGGGGVLTISVRPGEASPLRHALAAEGLLLVE